MTKFLRALIGVFKPLFRLKFLEKLTSIYFNPFYRYRSLFISPVGDYSEPTIRKCRVNEINYSLDISEHISWQLYFQYNTNLVTDFVKMVRPGNIVLDVGANIGQFSLPILKKLNSEGRLYCFEPDFENRNKLKTNIDLNTWDNYEILAYGLGNSNELYSMVNPDTRNKGMNRISSKSDVDSKKRVEVKRLDDVAKELGITTIDIIKVDIEGFENEFLKGARNTLFNFQPILVMELSSENLREQNSDPEEVLNFLLSLGYDLILDAATYMPLKWKSEKPIVEIDIIAYSTKN